MQDVKKYIKLCYSVFMENLKMKRKGQNNFELPMLGFEPRNFEQNMHYSAKFPQFFLLYFWLIDRSLRAFDIVLSVPWRIETTNTMQKGQSNTAQIGQDQTAWSWHRS